MPLISIIIPAYNEEASILRVIEQLKKENEDVDYLVVNDCSGDQTEDYLQQAGAEYVSLPLNMGIGGAVQTGYQYAWRNHYDIVKKTNDRRRYKTSVHYSGNSKQMGS